MGWGRLDGAGRGGQSESSVTKKAEGASGRDGWVIGWGFEDGGF